MTVRWRLRECRRDNFMRRDAQMVPPDHRRSWLNTSPAWPREKMLRVFGVGLLSSDSAHELSPFFSSLLADRTCIAPDPPGDLE